MQEALSHEFLSSPEETRFLLSILHWLFGGILLMIGSLLLKRGLHPSNRLGRILQLMWASLLIFLGMLLLIFFLLPNGFIQSLQLIPYDPIPRLYVLVGLYCVWAGYAELMQDLKGFTGWVWQSAFAVMLGMSGVLFLLHRIITGNAFTEWMYDPLLPTLIGLLFIVAGAVYGYACVITNKRWGSIVTGLLLIAASFVIIVYREPVQIIHVQHELYPLFNLFP